MPPESPTGPPPDKRQANCEAVQRVDATALAGSPSAPAAADPGIPLADGTSLGPYRILSELGIGGMGRVYLAEVTQATAGLEPGARVALKIIHSHLLDVLPMYREIRQAVGMS